MLLQRTVRRACPAHARHSRLARERMAGSMTDPIQGPLSGHGDPGPVGLPSLFCCHITKQVMKNLGAILEEAGSSWEKVVKTTILLGARSPQHASGEPPRSWLSQRSCGPASRVPSPAAHGHTASTANVPWLHAILPACLCHQHVNPPFASALLACVCCS